MSLPNSEPLPEYINELAPARQRHIRRRPRMASLAERQLLLESLLALTAPTLNFFLLSLLGSITLGAALYFDDPAVLILALILLPFFKPVFGLALLPAARKASHALKSLVSLLILLVFVLSAGILAGWLKKEFAPANINMYRLSVPYYLDLAMVSLSAVFGVFVMIRTGRLPRLVGVLLSYEILLPLAAAGFGFPLGTAQVFPGALLVSLAHLGLAFLLGASTFFLLGLGPRRMAGWFFLLVPLLLAMSGLLLSLPEFPAFITENFRPSATPSPTAIPSNTPIRLVSATSTINVTLPPTLTKTHGPTQTHTPEPTETRTPTQTQTPQPTSFWALVDTPQGAVLRESPTFDSPITGYLNNGDTVEILDVVTSVEGSLWYRVSTLGGQKGWLLGSLVNTQTPTPTPE